MSTVALATGRRRAADLLARRRSRLDRLRVSLADGRATTLHVASYELAAFAPRVARLEGPAPLARWCREQRLRDAVVAGFFLRPSYAPLGELWIGGHRQPSVPFAEPWGAVRACLQIEGGRVQIARRQALAATPGGDLLQAGPLLLHGGRLALGDGDGDGDEEGFSAAAHQFDSDITDGRYPRAALALAGERLLAVACDGRAQSDAGMTLRELAEALLALGAHEAINLDGGGSASLVYGGRLRNRPREEHGLDLVGGRAVVTAIVFAPRRD
jgi:hypothetical protein